MKAPVLKLGLVALLLTAGLTMPSQASVYFSIGVGGGEPQYRHYNAHPDSYFRSDPYCRPAPFARAYQTYVGPSVVIVPRPVAVTRSVPYGFTQSGGLVRSPYTNFTVSNGGYSPGDVVYDANNGRPFLIP